MSQPLQATCTMVHHPPWEYFFPLHPIWISSVETCNRQNDASWNSYAYLHVFILRRGTGKDMESPLSAAASTRDTESSASSREPRDSWVIWHSWEGQMHLFFGADHRWSGILPCSPKHLLKLELYTCNKVMPSTSNTGGKRVTKVTLVPATPASIPVPQ